MVAVDIYLNETTRHADLILPSSVQLEHDNYDFLFEQTSVRNFARYSPAFFEAEETLRPHWQILCELGARLNGVTWEQVDDMMLGGMLAAMVGPETGCPDVTPEEAREKLGDARGPIRLVEAMIRVGPYGDRFDDANDGLNMTRLSGEEHGVDLGALGEMLPGALPHGRIDLVPEYLAGDLPRLASSLAERSKPGGMVLVGRRQMRNMNSWLHNLPALAKGQDRCTLLLNPKDASELGIENRGRAIIASRVGQVEAEVKVTDEMMPGVVSLPHGFGHTVPGIQMTVANEKQPGPCSNYLTDELALDIISGTHIANGIPVEVRAAEG